MFLKNNRIPVKKLVLFFTVSLFFCSCLIPVRRFHKYKSPTAPDYSDHACWSALPTKKDSADISISGTNIVDKQSSSAIDVFYVHPTTYLTGGRWNADLRNKSANKKTDELAVRNQASIFNETCKVYAPRYRQAVLFSYAKYAKKKGDAPQSFGLAYTDVKAAFTYYLQNLNKGRPFIIASHSQGTDHTVRLLNDFFTADTLLKKQLVAAYIIGRPIRIEDVKAIPPCDSAKQTGCYVTWNTVPWDEPTYYGEKVKGLVCVNPLSWSRDTLTAPAFLNKGGLPQSFNKLDEGLTDAKVSPSGLLWTHRPAVTKKNYPTINSQRFHLLDYNLFYMNIRENIKLRANQYFVLIGKH